MRWMELDYKIFRLYTSGRGKHVHTRGFTRARNRKPSTRRQSQSLVCVFRLHMSRFDDSAARNFHQLNGTYRRLSTPFAFVLQVLQSQICFPEV
jgi:hypothetical protein